jgi:hypothetical protein
MCAPFADVLYAGDEPWWKEYMPKVKRQGFSGELWTGSFGARARFPELRLIPTSMAIRGLPRQSGVLGHGGNSGYQVAGLAALFVGPTGKITLLGYDMKRTRGKSHHHGDHPRPLNSLGNYRVWVDRFGVLATDLEKAGYDVVNCTRDTALKCFRFATLEERLYEPARLARAEEGVAHHARCG